MSAGRHQLSFAVSAWTASKPVRRRGPARTIPAALVGVRYLPPPIRDATPASDLAGSSDDVGVVVASIEHHGSTVLGVVRPERSDSDAGRSTGRNARARALPTAGGYRGLEGRWLEAGWYQLEGGQHGGWHSGWKHEIAVGRVVGGRSMARRSTSKFIRLFDIGTQRSGD